MKKYTLITVLLLIAVMVVSCGKTHDIGELRAALEELLPKSAELNEIYFGEGLPLASDREMVEKFYSSFDSDVSMVNYHPVDADCGYTSEADIREATLAVFSQDYSSYLFDRAFTGISSVSNEGSQNEITQTASYAMYIEQNGTLTVRIDVADEALPLGREYDIAEASIVHARKNYVILSVPSTFEGKQLDVELKLVMTDDGWRLDSPTY